MPRQEIINIVNEKMNKTSISSVVCLDIIDFSKKTEAEQLDIKKQVNYLIDLAVIDIPEKDRMIVDTGHGAIITCSGSLENSLEDALFIALTIRDEVLNSNADSETPLYLLIGINLGSVRVEKSSNAKQAPNIIGDGLVEAQRIMSFANPNQILVSRAYYDMASKLTLEIAQMFEKYDMHVYEHDIYAVRLLKDKATVDNYLADVADNTETQEAAVHSTFDWRVYALPILLGFIMLFVLIKWMKNDEPANVIDQPVVTNSAMDEPATLTAEPPLESGVPVDEASSQTGVAQEKTTQDKPAQASAAEKKPTKKSVVKAKSKPITSKPEQSAVIVEGTKSAESTTGASVSSEKSGWETFKESIKQGAAKECTQAERALNQCVE